MKKVRTKKFRSFYLEMCIAFAESLITHDKIEAPKSDNLNKNNIKHRADEWIRRICW